MNTNEELSNKSSEEIMKLIEERDERNIKAIEEGAILIPEDDLYDHYFAARAREENRDSAGGRSNSDD